MDLAASLVADLAALGGALDEPDVDLAAQLRALTSCLEQALTSYLGLRITMVLEGRELVLTSFIDPNARTRIATSMRLPLEIVSGMPNGSTLVLYAATPGAFVDLAADVSFALALDLSAVALDQDRTPISAPDGIEGLRPWCDINQAIGVLLGQGHTIASAHLELRRLADLDSGNPHHAAAAILAAAATPIASGSD